MRYTVDLKIYFNSIILILFLSFNSIHAQEPDQTEWIRPEKYSDQAIWGVKNGMPMAFAYRKSI